jgi:uronate dehydrogenase
VERCLVSERIGHTVVNGISDNQEAFFSNHKVAHLGYRPQDSAETYRREVEAEVGPGDPFDSTIEYVGGFLCASGHPDEDKPL